VQRVPQLGGGSSTVNGTSNLLRLAARSCSESVPVTSSHVASSTGVIRPDVGVLRSATWVEESKIPQSVVA
jgi:hypothetical protein